MSDDRTIRVAVGQLRTGEDVDANLAEIAALTQDAARAGAGLLAVPEYATYLGDNAKFESVAEPIATGTTVGAIRDMARSHEIAVHLGSTVEDGGDGNIYNTSLLIGADGEIVSSYRKMHLFTSNLDVAATSEADYITPGSEVVVAPWRGWNLGMSICFDVRFPEMYRDLVARGADVLMVPAAFVAYTGKDHWDVLLRARAIENQSYVIAPAHVGRFHGGESYGRSCIIDPWGTVLATVGDGAGSALAVADLRRERLEQVRRDLPALDQRRYGPATAPA
ncbi:carbon-nitrogen hydrolase family protein [Streptomyces sp. NBC_00144]|uniref:carbon-nitrogen hydrolase family protein n=1 Tax=Streptomyces sp. NBC_00144 TaxID=2975665 RepID=UPI00324C7C7D